MNKFLALKATSFNYNLKQSLDLKKLLQEYKNSFKYNILKKIKYTSSF